MINLRNLSVWKRQDKRAPGRPMYKWQDDMKISLKKIRWDYGLDSPGSGQ
jgi:hypothetical protein